MREWYQSHGLWLRESKSWEFNEYGFRPEGIGDCIFNTCNKIIEDNDTSEWAIYSIHRCGILLAQRKRWPDELHPLQAATNWFDWKFSAWMFRHGKIDQRLYRPQGNQTRDGYIAYFAVCAMFGYTELIKDVTVPLHLYRPNLWAWRKYLITGKEKYKRRYYFWEWFNFFEPGYTKRLTELMEMVI